jgi:hypothetical protein
VHLPPQNDPRQQGSPPAFKKLSATDISSARHDLPQSNNSENRVGPFKQSSNLPVNQARNFPTSVSEMIAEQKKNSAFTSTTTNPLLRPATFKRKRAD